MTDREHENLAAVLSAAKGWVAFSNYDCDFLNRLYPAPKWRKTVGLPKINHATKGVLTEVLWTNYAVLSREEDRSLFD